MWENCLLLEEGCLGLVCLPEGRPVAYYHYMWGRTWRVEVGGGEKQVGTGDPPSGHRVPWADWHYSMLMACPGLAV